MKAPKTSAPVIDTGIDAKDRAKIAAGLSKLLADTFTVYLKTHNFHWNVTGPMFNTLHLMFETQYTELWTATREAHLDQGDRRTAEGRGDDPAPGRRQ